METSSPPAPITQAIQPPSLPDAKGPLRHADLYTPQEAADYLRLADFGCKNPLQTLEYLCSSNQIECITVVNRRGFMREQLDRYLTRQLAPPRRA